MSGCLHVEIDTASAEVRHLHVDADAADAVLLGGKPNVLLEQQPPVVALEEIVRQGPRGPRGLPGRELVTDEFTVTPAILVARKVMLSETPLDPQKVELIVFGGIEQQPAVDFVVEGRELSWAGLAMELLLESGSVFQARYLME